MTLKVVQQMMILLSGIAGIRATHTVPATQATCADPLYTTIPKMDEAFWTEYDLLSATTTYHDRDRAYIIDQILKLKTLLFHGIGDDDIFEFILACYERLHELGIPQQHGVEFVTF